MPKVSKKVAQESENSPKQKSTTRETKHVNSDEIITGRLPRAAKTKADKKITETYVLPPKKTRGKPALLRSNSSEDIAPKANGTTNQKRMRRSKSVEPIYQQSAPAAKKSRDDGEKKVPAKKNGGKKAGTEAKGKTRGKVTKEIEPIHEEEDADEEMEVDQPPPPLMATKAYGKSTAKKVTAPMKKGRSKKATNDTEEKQDEQPEEEVSTGSKVSKPEAKAAKGKRGKAAPAAKNRGKKAVVTTEEMNHSENDESDGDVEMAEKNKPKEAMDTSVENGKSVLPNDNADDDSDQLEIP